MEDKRAPQEVIDWINEGRKVLGLERLPDLPRGYRGSPHTCPFATALKIRGGPGVYVVASMILFGTDTDFDYLRINMPNYVSRFREDFDNGLYPRYAIW